MYLQRGPGELLRMVIQDLKEDQYCSYTKDVAEIVDENVCNAPWGSVTWWGYIGMCVGGFPENEAFVRRFNWRRRKRVGAICNSVHANTAFTWISVFRFYRAHSCFVSQIPVSLRTSCGAPYGGLWRSLSNTTQGQTVANWPDSASNKMLWAPLWSVLSLIVASCPALLWCNLY